MLEGARERRIRTGGIELCVAELGDPARPTVVLVHGYPDSKEVWSEVAVRLARDFHVVLYDVRGHGRSTAPKPLRGGFTLAKLTDDFLAVVDAVSPDRPVHLVGHDWGSVQSWEFVTVARTKGRIASFTSMSGPSLDHFGHWINARVKRPTPRRIGQLLGQGAKSWYVYLLHTPVLPELAWRGPLGKRWPALLQRAEKVPADGYPTASLPSDAAHGAWLYRDNVRPRLRKPRPDAHAHVPVQLVTPEGDAFLSPRLYDDLEQWVPRLVRRVLPAKHWIPRTRPDQLALWITEFVESVEQGEPASVPEGRHGDRFAGQLVLVTGAGDGTGRATAFAFAEAGARVVAVDRDPEAATRTAELALLLGASGAWAEAVDVSDEQAVEKLAARVHGEHGVVDVLVNGAGVDLPDSLLASPADDWRAALEVNVFGALHSCRLFGARMVERGQGGHIVNIGSAVTDLSDRLRAELSVHDIGVTVACAAPDANWPPEKAASAILDAVAQNEPTVAKRASVVHRIANFFVDN
ncbi:SDR family oxidoreductase [Streptomyces sp. NPDC003656]